MELKIQFYLRNCGLPRVSDEEALEGLHRQYSIIHRRHPKYPNLVLFKYDQINSPFAETIVRECRGIILDQNKNWNIVSRAFDKFFNYGEGRAAKIDWNTAQVQEKVDGSLCVLYHYDGKWHVQTSGSPDASGDVHSSGEKFADYFWRTFEASGGHLSRVASDCCYYFELTGPLNRIVVVHEQPKVTALGMRDLHNGKELPADACEIVTGVKATRSFPLKSFEDIADSFKNMSPLSQEGYVVVDGQYNRVKVKHPGYVALHHAKDGMTYKAFVEIARSGETSEVITAFPEFRPMMEEAKKKVDAIVNEVEADYARLVSIQDQKEFALEALKTRCSAALFAARRGKTSSIRRFFAEMRIDSLLEMIK